MQQYVSESEMAKCLLPSGRSALRCVNKTRSADLMAMHISNVPGTLPGRSTPPYSIPESQFMHLRAGQVYATELVSRHWLNKRLSEI